MTNIVDSDTLYASFLCAPCHFSVQAALGHKEHSLVHTDIVAINSFQCFALIQLLTSGGPNNSTMTIMYYIYYQAFKLYKYGYGNAMGVILAIIIAIMSAIQFKLGEEK